MVIMCIDEGLISCYKQDEFEALFKNNNPK